MNLKPLQYRWSHPLMAFCSPGLGRSLPVSALWRLVSATVLVLLIVAPSLAESFPEEEPQSLVTTINRSWVVEAEFDADASLHATEGQTVVLELEPWSGRQSPLRENHMRFLVEKEGQYSFCIPADEPYLVRFKLKRQNGPTVLNGRRGASCEPVTLARGSYVLDIFHDSRTAPAGGALAFLHQPERFGRSVGDAGYVIPNYDFAAFRAENGKFITDATGGQPFYVGATATDVGPSEVWRVVERDPTNAEFAFRNGAGSTMSICNSASTSIITGQCSEGVLTATFRYWEFSPFNFSLELWIALSWKEIFTGPVSPDANDYLTFFGLQDYSYTADYEGYDCATKCDDSTLPLARGQVALYSKCDFEGPAIVFAADKADLSLYDSAAAANLGIGSNGARAIRVGPDTVARLYSESQYGGISITAAADVPCLDDTALGNDALSSFQIVQETVPQYILSSQGCRNCILTGIDLSNEDFGGLDFSGSTFGGANLSGTNFAAANLTGARFNGVATRLAATDFSHATLRCASFFSADVTGARFEGIVLPDDFSCYLDLQGATIDYSNFAPESWRRMNLTASAMTNVPDILSTFAAPLDLSGALLNQVQWLSKKTLDDANLGCATATMTNCTQLIDTNLNQTSLVGANLADAVLNGANLSNANLTAANLEGAQLLKSPTTQTSATLRGASLKNANLAQADLSGAILTNANWYSTSNGPCPGSTWVGTCASGEDAVLNSTHLQDAYLSGLDLSDATPQGADFTGAIMLGANLTGANLSRDPDTGGATSFANAFLQGADFTDAITTGADFSSAYIDLSSGSGATRLFQLPFPNLNFTGYTPSAGGIEGCIEFTYSKATLIPAITDDENKCPDEGDGPCTLARWQSPTTPIQDAAPPSTADIVTGLSNGCNLTTVDVNWILQ